MPVSEGKHSGEKTNVKPIAVFVVAFGAAVLLLRLTDLDAVEGAAVASIVAFAAATLSAGWRRRL